MPGDRDNEEGHRGSQQTPLAQREIGALQRELFDTADMERVGANVEVITATNHWIAANDKETFWVWSSLFFCVNACRESTGPLFMPQRQLDGRRVG